MIVYFTKDIFREGEWGYNPYTTPLPRYNTDDRDEEIRSIILTVYK